MARHTISAKLTFVVAMDVDLAEDMTIADLQKMANKQNYFGTFKVRPGGYIEDVYGELNYLSGEERG